jgi:hypothetical protein
MGHVPRRFRGSLAALLKDRKPAPQKSAAEPGASPAPPGGGSASPAPGPDAKQGPESPPPAAEESLHWAPPLERRPFDPLDKE